MRIYITYKFSGTDPAMLKANLTRIAKAIEDLGHETFIFSRDVDKWEEPILPNKEIMPIAFKEIASSDVQLVFIEEYRKSTGMGLEIGYAKGKDLPVILAVTKGENCDYLMGLYDKLVEFVDLDELVRKIGGGEVF